MSEPKDTTIATIMEHLLEQGPGGMADVFTSLLNLAMGLERERFLGGAHYERTDGRAVTPTASSPRSSTRRPAPSRWTSPRPPARNRRSTPPHWSAAGAPGAP